MGRGHVVLDEIDLFRFASPDDIKPFMLIFDSNLILNSFRTGLDYETQSNTKDRLPPKTVKRNYILKPSMAAKRSLAAMIGGSNTDEQDGVQVSGNKKSKKDKSVKT